MKVWREAHHVVLGRIIMWQYVKINQCATVLNLPPTLLSLALTGGADGRGGGKETVPSRNLVMPTHVSLLSNYIVSFQQIQEKDNMVPA